MSAATPVITSSDPTIQAALLRIATFGPFGYRPSLVGNVIFCAIYGLCFVLLTYQAIRHRRWWLLATLAFGSLLECTGNAIRVYGHFTPTDVNAYIAQQVILVLTPAFFAAAHFTILTKTCSLFGPRYIAPLKPSWLIPFFVLLDVTSLGIQGGGSGQAAVAEIVGKPVDTINGYGQVVTAGLAVQLVGYLAFNAIFVLFVYRASQQAHQHNGLWNGKMKTFLFATWLSALFVLGRSVFRTAEMAKGWIGEVATTEWYYLVFDATFVTFALLILVVFSPTVYLPTSNVTHRDLPSTSSDLVLAETQLQRSASPMTFVSTTSSDEKLNFHI